jgi:uncharacterized protein YjfI (DUF2170 family)
MSEKINLPPQETSPSKKEAFESLSSLFDEAEKVFEIEGREKAKELLPKLYEDLFALNRTSKEGLITLVWNPDGDLTEEDFNTLNLRRKKLSNDIGIKTASGEIRHDLNKL